MDTQLTLKVVIVGPSGAGKTTLRRQFKGEADVSNSPSTIGVDFSTLRKYVRGRTYQVQLWDTAGSARFAPITDAAYAHSDVIIGVVDLHRAYNHMMDTSKTSAARNMDELMDEFLHMEMERIRHALHKVSDTIHKPRFVLLGNKTDLLAGAHVDFKEVSIRNRLKATVESEHNGVYFDVSALTGSGVVRAFDCILDSAARVFENKHSLFHERKALVDRPLAPRFPIDSSRGSDDSDDDDDEGDRYTDGGAGPFGSNGRRDDDSDDDDNFIVARRNHLVTPWWRFWLCCR